MFMRLDRLSLNYLQKMQVISARLPFPTKHLHFLHVFTSHMELVRSLRTDQVFIDVKRCAGL